MTDSVHPRACGGNYTPASTRPEGEGPSPRVRGKLVRPAERLRFSGSIPARAGETVPAK